MDNGSGDLRAFVIGTGVMGKGIVQVLAESEQVSSVAWKDISLDYVERAFSELSAKWGRMVEKKRLSAEDAVRFSQKIVCTDSYAALVDTQLVIEAVSEDLDAKRALFAQLSGLVSRSTIIASNTSSLSITELASLMQYPDNVIGLHFFNPAHVMKLTEVTVGLTTSQETCDRTLDIARRIGKTPILVKETPGFIVNRMLIPMINEAVGILAEGVASAKDIDRAMCLGANHPIGPLALADLIGNDVNLSIMETLQRETGDQKYRPHPLLRQMVRANRLGRKTGHGFFEY